MSRDLDTPVAEGIAAKVVNFCFFAEFEFASGPVRMWSGYGDKTWNSLTWTGGGDLIGMSQIEETTEIGASGMRFTLAGVKSSLRALALADKYRGKPCRVWLAILENDLTTVAGAYRIFGGRMNVMNLTAADAEFSRIALEAENRLNDLRRPRTRRYTPAEQKKRNPTDTALDRIGSLAERPLYWGIPYGAGAVPNNTSGGSQEASE